MRDNFAKAAQCVRLAEHHARYTEQADKGPRARAKKNCGDAFTIEKTLAGEKDGALEALARAIEAVTLEHQDAADSPLWDRMADRLFVLRDTLISVVDKELVPYYYRKGALEGDRYTVDEAWYSYGGGKNHVKLRFKTHRDEIRHAEQQTSLCVYDMLSMMLRARSFDASDYKVGQKIHFPMVDGGKVEEQTLIYRGKKTFKMEESKTKYRCLVFSFVEYEEGKEKEVVTFYITDDLNHLPVRLDMYLRFGSAKAFLTEAKGVRNPQTSIIK